MSNDIHLDDDNRLELEELQILLNIMGNRLRIGYPLYDFDFLEAHTDYDGYKIKVTCQESDFDKRLARTRGRNHSFELPSYSDFRGGLISSGVLPFTNLAEFTTRLSTYQTLKKDVKFSLDTNLLYFRFVSNYGLIKPSEIVLVKTVGNELKSKLNHKYSPDKLSAVKRLVKNNNHLLDALWNRRIKRSRKAAYIALWEYRYILDGVADELEEFRRPETTNRDNDMIIVKTLSKLEKEGHTFPVLLTADDAMADLCIAEGLEYFKFDIPHAVEAKKCNYKQMLNLIFNLAAVYGFIKVNNVVIFGEFRGKSSNKPNELNLEFSDKNLQSNFVRDLRICRRLMELNIEK